MKIHIGKSKIHNKGLFAGEDINKGKIIAFIKGKIVHFVVKNKKDARHGPDWVGIGHNTWIDPAEPFCYLNHSCNPNVGIRGKVTLIALRDIKNGEEVTIDYSITEETKDWIMKCHCGSKNCRKIIRSIQFLPRNTFLKYTPFVGCYFSNLYKKLYNEK